jgi:three-Cys-motif partner protein
MGTTEDGPRIDPSDGLLATPVGVWAKDKHKLLADYIQIARGVRQRFVAPGKAGATLIDLYCGAGRAYVRDTGEFIDGSPLVAWKAAQKHGVPFTQVYLNDQEGELSSAAESRLRALGAPVIAYSEPAENVAAKLVNSLNKHALHFAFIDPFRLLLPFSLIRSLAVLKRIDMLIHVSAMDLQRNWRSYSQSATSPLDTFNPGWRLRVDSSGSQESARVAFIHDWVEQLKTLGFEGEVRFELITGTKSQPLYWLVLVAKHELANMFWRIAAQLGKTGDLFGS